MALQYVGTNKVTGNTGTLTLSLTALTGGIDTAARAGDFVIAAYAAVSTSNLSLTVGDGTWDSPTGLWANDTRDANLRIATKVMTGTPDTQVQGSGQTTATNGAVMVCHVWRGLDTSTPLDVAVVSVTGTNSALPNPDPITPVTANAVLIAIGAGSGTAVNNAVTAPSGYGNLAQVTVDPGNSITCAIASKVWGGAGAEDPAAFGGLTTTTSDGWAAYTLAIRPAAATVATVTTQAASSVGTTTATGNGNITDTGGANPDTRGIVYSTTTHGAPGNVAPGSSGYESVVNETGGSFGTGAFTEALTGLASNTAYFARAYTHNSSGYSYGSEVSFTTVATFSDRRRLFIDHIVSAQNEAHGWNIERANIPDSAMVRTSGTVATLTIPAGALAAYDITADEHLTVTVPGEVLTGATDIVATPTVDIVAGAAGQTGTPTAATTTWAGGAASAIPGARAVAATAGTTTWSGGTATGVPGARTIIAVSAATTWAGGSATVQAVRTVTATAGATAWAGGSASAITSGSAAATAGATVWFGGTVSAFGGPTTKTATSGTTVWAGGSATAIPGARTATAGTGATIWQGGTAAGVPGVRLATATAGATVWATGTLVAIPGARTVTASAGSTVWAGGAATGTIGAVVVGATAGATIWSAQTASYTAGPVTKAASAAETVWTGADAAAIVSGLALALAGQTIWTGGTAQPQPGAVTAAALAAVLVWSGGVAAGVPGVAAVSALAATTAWEGISPIAFGGPTFTPATAADTIWIAPLAVAAILRKGIDTDALWLAATYAPRALMAAVFAPRTELRAISQPRVTLAARG